MYWTVAHWAFCFQRESRVIPGPVRNILLSSPLWCMGVLPDILLRHYIAP